MIQISSHIVGCIAVTIEILFSENAVPTPTSSLKVHPTPAACSEGEEQLGARWVCMCVNAYVCADVCACVTFYMFVYLLLRIGKPAWRLCAVATEALVGWILLIQRDTEKM